jgi:hypothetical protein
MPFAAVAKEIQRDPTEFGHGSQITGREIGTPLDRYTYVLDQVLRPTRAYICQIVVHHSHGMAGPPHTDIALALFVQVCRVSGCAPCRSTRDAADV